MQNSKADCNQVPFVHHHYDSKWNFFSHVVSFNKRNKNLDLFDQFLGEEGGCVSSSGRGKKTADITVGKFYIYYFTTCKLALNRQ